MLSGIKHGHRIQFLNFVFGFWVLFVSMETKWMIEALTLAKSVFPSSAFSFSNNKHPRPHWVWVYGLKIHLSNKDNGKKILPISSLHWSECAQVWIANDAALGWKIFDSCKLKCRRKKNLKIFRSISNAYSVARTVRSEFKSLEQNRNGTK